MRYQALVAAVDAGAIPASALNELGDDDDDGAILDEGRDDERTGARYNVRFFFFGGGRKGNATCTVTPVRRMWDSSTACRWALAPVG